MRKNKEKQPARMTVAELQTTLGVPLHVQVWLDRFARGDEYALQKFGCDDEPGVNETAFLIYDVLNAQYDGSDVLESSEDARDFVEEWLYTLSNFYDQHIWNNADAALTLLPWVMDNSGGSPIQPEGDAVYVLLRAAIERLTTKSERRAFLRQDAEQEPDREEETDRRAAFKLARVLADPRTSTETRRQVQESIVELCNAANVLVDHPALVRRAFLVACDQHPKGQVRELKRARRSLLALLDSISEEEGGAS